MLYRNTFTLCLTSRFRASSFDVLAACHADRRWAIDFGNDPLRCALIGVESWTLNGDLGVLDPENGP